MFGQEPPNFVEQFRHQNYTRTANKTVTSKQAIHPCRWPKIGFYLWQELSKKAERACIN